MKKTEKNTTTVTVKQFELEVPAPFNIEPMATIAVSKNYSVRIFKHKRTSEECVEWEGKTIRKPVEKEVYRCVCLHNKSGRPPNRSTDYKYTGSYYVDCESELDVRMHLERLASDLAPKTRVVREETDEE